jgi:two-component system, sensor histidine kinase
MYEVSQPVRKASPQCSLEPDMALVDIGLPDIDGYEVARRVRALRLTTAPRLIAISGFGQPEDLRRAYDAGFDLHLTKPVAPVFLREVIGALVSARGHPHSQRMLTDAS